MTTTAIADTACLLSPERPACFPTRLCAAVALASVGAHVWMGWVHRAMPWEGALMLLMAAACLPCAVSVWRRGHDRAVRQLFVMALTMVAVHAALLLAPGAMAGHAGMGSMDSTASKGGDMAGKVPLSASMLGIVALELVVAALAAWSMRRKRLPQSPLRRRSADSCPMSPGFGRWDSVPDIPGCQDPGRPGHSLPAQGS